MRSSRVCPATGPRNGRRAGAVPGREQGDREQELGQVAAVVHERGGVAQAVQVVGEDQLGQVRVRPAGEHEHDGAGGHRGSVRRRVRARDRPREQHPGRHDVQVHQRADGAVGGREGVQRRQVQDVQPADGQDRGGHRVGEHVQRPAAQHRPRDAPGRDRQRAQQERAGRAEHQRDRREHAQEQVLDHVQVGVVVPGRPQQGRHGQGHQHQPHDGARRAQRRPRPPAGPDQRRVRRRRHQHEQRGDQPAQHRDGGTGVAGVRHRPLPRTGAPSCRPRRASIAPTSRRSTPEPLQARS